MQPIPAARYKVSGKYKAAAHTGHTFDADGNLVSEGIVLRESGWGDNLITLNGFYWMLTAAQTKLMAVAGIGNTTPTEGDTTLTSYRGASSSLVSMTRTVNATPDVDGYVTIEFNYRWTFNPGRLGSGSINVAEAGVIANTSSPTSATPIGSHGLLVDSSGDPTTVSYIADEEYLDLYWKLTFYIPAEITGTVTMDIDGVPTNFNYVCRPVNFTATFLTPSSGYLPGWQYAVGKSSPVFSSKVSATPIQDLNSYPASPWVNLSSVSSGAISYGDKQRVVTLACSPSGGNVAGGILSVVVNGTNAGGSGQMFGFQIEYDPKLPKDSDHAMTLPYLLSLSNK